MIDFFDLGGYGLFVCSVANQKLQNTEKKELPLVALFFLFLQIFWFAPATTSIPAAGACVLRHYTLQIIAYKINTKFL
jgi:hypothetical protein